MQTEKTPNNSEMPVARQYGDVAAIYDALMAGVPHGIWLARIEREAEARGKRPRSALDAACGTGITTQKLYRQGYRPVVGFDISPAMISIARTKAVPLGSPPDLRYMVQDATTLDLNGATFDLVVSLFDSLNYILEPVKLRAAFAHIFLHTTPGGMLAFDMNSLYALRTHMFTQTQEVGPVRHRWQSFWDEQTRLCRVEMDFQVEDEKTKEVRHFQETHLQRGYTVQEIYAALTEVGYTRIAAYGNYGTYPPGPKSDRLLFVAERPL